MDDGGFPGIAQSTYRWLVLQGLEGDHFKQKLALKASGNFHQTSPLYYFYTQCL